MQIVIDIPEEEYIRICDEPCTELGLAVRNGTPLPKDAEILTKEAYSDLCMRAADHEGEGMTYKEKSSIVIAQLRADRDRLQDALDKIRVEIKSMDFDFGDYYDHSDEIIEMVCKTIDKYKAESEE